MRSTRRAFTLIELLVVIAIIAVLIGLLLPAVQKVREAANRAKCTSNLRQMSLAALNYESSFQYLPPGQGARPTLFTAPRTAPGGSRASIQALILPYVEQANKYDQFNFDYDVHEEPINVPAQEQDVPIYVCPSDPSTARYFRAGWSNYFGSIGATASQRSTDPARVGIFNVTLDGGVVINRVKMASISDGTSNTAMFSEVKRSMIVYNANQDTPLNVTIIRSGWDDLAPVRPACDTPPTPADTLRYTGHQYYRNLNITMVYSHTVPPNYKARSCISSSFYQSHLAARSYHPGGVNVALCDGSVRFVRDNVRFATWQALGTRSGSEVLDGSDL